MAELKVSEQTQALLSDPLLGEGDADAKILRLVEGELSRQLEYQRILDQTMAQKYAMSFAEFVERRTSVQHSNSWEVETDTTAWEAAMRAVTAITQKLAKIQELQASASE